jgi:hypothetical protein
MGFTRSRRSDDVKQVKQDDDRDRDPEQPEQNASTHNDLLTSMVLFLARDLANRILCVADSALNPAFGLIGLSLGFGLGITQHFAGLFLDLAGDLLHASSDPILVHCQFLCFD